MKLAAPAVARIAMQALLVKRPAFLMLDHASFFMKLLQVRTHRLSRRRMKIFGHIGVDLLDHRDHFQWSLGGRRAPGARATPDERCTRESFPWACESPGRAPDRWSPKSRLEQAVQRIHILPEIAGIVRNHRGARAEHDVTGEERLLLDQVVAKMIGSMTGGVNRAQRRARRSDSRRCHRWGRWERRPTASGPGSATASCRLFDARRSFARHL